MNSCAKMRRLCPPEVTTVHHGRLLEMQALLARPHLAQSQWLQLSDLRLQQLLPAGHLQGGDHGYQWRN